MSCIVCKKRNGAHICTLCGKTCNDLAALEMHARQRHDALGEGHLIAAAPPDAAPSRSKRAGGDVDYVSLHEGGGAAATSRDSGPPTTPTTKKSTTAMRVSASAASASDDGAGDDGRVVPAAGGAVRRAATLARIDDSGNQVWTAAEQARQDQINSDSAAARDDEDLASVLQSAERKRQLALNEAEKLRSKKSRRKRSAATDASAGLLREIGFFDVDEARSDGKARCCLCKKNFSVSGGNGLTHYKNSHPHIHALNQRLKDEKRPRQLAEYELKAAMFETLKSSSKSSGSSKIQSPITAHVTPTARYDVFCVARVLELVSSGIGFNHLEHGLSQLVCTAANFKALLQTDARRYFALIAQFCKKEIGREMGDDALVDITCDGWSKDGAKVIGVTAHWLSENWTPSRALVGLIDLEDYQESGAVETQAVLTAVQHRLPDSLQLFATTTDNASPARLAGDALSGNAGFGCMCHQLSLVVKIDVFKNSEIGQKLNNTFDKIRALITFVSRHQLKSALKTVQEAAGIFELFTRQLQDEVATRWHSTLTMLESFIAVRPHLIALANNGTISFDGDMGALLVHSEMELVRQTIDLLKIVRCASRQMEASKTPTMSRCLPTLVAMMEVLAQYFLSPAVAMDLPCKELARELIRAVWRRIRDAVLGPSWMTVSMALSPRFADFDFIVRAVDVIKKCEIEPEEEEVTPAKLEDLRDQVAKRLFHEINQTTGKKRAKSPAEPIDPDADVDDKLEESYDNGGGEDDGYCSSDDGADLRLKGNIQIALKHIYRVARRRTQVKPVDAEDLLYVENVLHGTTDSFAVADDLLFWSMIEAYTQKKMEFVLPGVDLGDCAVCSDIPQFFVQRFSVHRDYIGRIFDDLPPLVSVHVKLIKAILAIQASSAESERFFSFLKRARAMAPTRALRTIADMAMIKSFFNARGFESDLPLAWRRWFDPCVEFIRSNPDLAPDEN